MLADDPTAAAVLAAFPCYPVPHQGRSPPLDTLRAAQAGQGLAIGNDGIMLILRRPWLAADLRIARPSSTYLPYGSIARTTAELRCGLIPVEPLHHILNHFRAALPNEAAAFILWNEATREFMVDLPVIEEATPSRLVYRPPVLGPDWHMVCDIHSHGTGPAFFSATDDTDDEHATKISLVIGRLDSRGGPVMAARLCAGGMFVTLPRSPFSGDSQCDLIPAPGTIFPRTSTIV